MDFDKMLYRPIVSGQEYEKLIPKPPGNKTAIGVGNTDFSIEAMEAMVKEFYPQMQKVANLLHKSSLQSTTEAVKDFVFNHFQYKADGDDQLLRSPSYAFWIDRKTGIDCKSYSIIASCILTNLGINHYIRKIKQPGFAPTEWTHVYVVVPVDQTTNNLKNNYYTIDGTLEEDYEPAFIETSDILMSLKHYKLNGAKPNSLGASAFGYTFNIKDLTSIKGIIASLSCLGEMAYSKNDLIANLTAIQNYYTTLITKINNSVKNGDDVAFANALAEFFGNSKMFVLAGESKIREGWRNPCTTRNMETTVKAFKFYRDTVGSALKIWLDDGFVKSNSANGSMAITSAGAKERLKINIIDASPTIVVSEPIFYYEPISLKPIKQFELTAYVAEVGGTATPVNPLQFLQGLTTTLATFGTDPNNNNNPTDNPTGTQDSNGNYVNPNQAQKAGFGVFGWVLLAVGIGIAVKGVSGLKNDKK